MDTSTVTPETDHARMPSARGWLGLVPFAIAVSVAAGLGGLAASSASAEYAALDQPFFAPPSWLFGPVWTVLYAMVAIAGWLTWRRTGVDAATWWWAGQLALNAAWTPIFFGAGAYGWALVEISLLLVALVVTIALTRTRSTAATWLLTPYLAWVTFAAVLNGSIWWLNR